ncbi:hypothetical protein [Pontiella agarivorans]|uniref:Uncharacterized protein n=1 Tax=Pontiella agarivorans TaxID=3038953 RepID=A0ABU5MWL3_9BACT|nr:hypothetical protein [Pontiella agarivorans]MDZ8118613.1 hypothetical protein [Pontiella agarivorans]
MMKLVRSIVAVLTLGGLAFVGGTFYFGTQTVHSLLAESEELKTAISTLTHEDQIGFAKVVKQEERDGTLYTTLKFVETARDDMLNRVLEKEFEIEGDVVHFDALIVTFSDQAVLDGKKRSLYLWRRVYGETMNPSEGFDIATPGTHPERYADLLRNLKQSEQDIFWEAIWNLSNDPNALQAYGVKAIYGNAVYKRLRPGLIYVFKIGTDGQIYPETVLDM